MIWGVRKKKKYRPNKLAIVLITLITVGLVYAMVVQTSALQKRLESYEARIDSLNQQIAEGTLTTEELEEYRNYMQTTSFIEEIAKKVLGLVEPGEIVVIPEDQ